MSVEEMRASDRAKVDAALRTLGEHFDTVQIFVTRHESGELDGTLTVQRGCGNWYARYGQVRYWLEEEIEVARCVARAAHKETSEGTE